MVKAIGCAMSISLALAAVGLLGGCETPQAGGSNLPEGPTKPWARSPGVIQDHLAAVGMSPLLNPRSEGPARTYAEADGRAKLAATLKARMRQLVENWSKDVGDMNLEASFSSYINNEAITQQLVDAEVRGTLPYDYDITQTNVYVLMVLKNPDQWTKNVGESYVDEVLKDNTLFKTQLLKEEFYKKMQDRISESVNNAREGQGLLGKIIGGMSEGDSK